MVATARATSQCSWSTTSADTHTHSSLAWALGLGLARAGFVFCHCSAKRANPRTTHLGGFACFASWSLYKLGSPSSQSCLLHAGFMLGMHNLLRRAQGRGDLATDFKFMLCGPLRLTSVDAPRHAGSMSSSRVLQGFQGFQRVTKAT